MVFLEERRRRGRRLATRPDLAHGSEEAEGEKTALIARFWLSLKHGLGGEQRDTTLLMKTVGVPGCLRAMARERGRKRHVRGGKLGSGATFLLVTSPPRAPRAVQLNLFQSSPFGWLEATEADDNEDDAHDTRVPLKRVALAFLVLRVIPPGSPFLSFSLLFPVMANDPDSLAITDSLRRLLHDDADDAELHDPHDPHEPAAATDAANSPDARAARPHPTTRGTRRSTPTIMADSLGDDPPASPSNTCTLSRRPLIPEGYGFRPLSGSSTPLLAAGPAADRGSPLPDVHGLGWPGASSLRLLRACSVHSELAHQPSQLCHVSTRHLPSVRHAKKSSQGPSGRFWNV